MTASRLQFTRLSDRDRKRAGPGLSISDGDEVELHVKDAHGADRMLIVPPEAAGLIGTVLDRLARGEQVAVVAAGREISPNATAEILGMSRPLVVHRMDVGDLPFRYVGKHRRAKLKDVLALQTRLDGERTALTALAADTEALMGGHAL
ncbi:MAG: DNA-binding protein [Pseudomonadota bacterium]|nr:DNA-binding protein [Pseudomonadota bacterium]